MPESSQEGQTSADVIDGYLGTKTVSAWRPLDLPVSTAGAAPAKWALVSDVSLGLFLSMSLMSLQLWMLVDLAGPLLILLATSLGGIIAGMIGLILAAPALAIAVDIERELKASGFFDDTQ